MKSAFWVVLPAVFLVTAGLAATADDPALHAPRSADAIKARARYDVAVTKAEREFEDATRVARTKYLDDLDQCLKAALQAEQLDEAVRLRDWKAALVRDRAVPVGRAAQEGAVAFRGSLYRVVLADVRWTEARAACRKRGGDLAVIDTKEKREFLSSQAGSVQLWVGAQYTQKAARWEWVNSAPVGPDAWTPGRPERNGPYAVMFGKTGLLGDGKDEVPDCKGYICEWGR